MCCKSTLFRLSLVLGAFVLGINSWGNVQAQSLPTEVKISPDRRTLLTGDEAVKGLYDPTILRTVKLDFVQENFWDLLHENYAEKKEIPATLTVDGEVFENVGVRFKGFTSYTPDGEKLSFNISLNYDGNEQDVMGYDNLNLHNGAEDPSFMREVLYRNLIRKHIPSLKGSYVKLFINGVSWGIYPNIQQPDGEFLKEWFMSSKGTRWRAITEEWRNSFGKTGQAPLAHKYALLQENRAIADDDTTDRGFSNGNGALNFLGDDQAEYERAYLLKKTRKDNPWPDLMKATEILEETPLDELEETLALHIDIDRALWFLATEILFIDDDSYVYKGTMDYYLYWEPETGRIIPLEYDGNSVMGEFYVTEWDVFYRAKNKYFPLVSRLLSVPNLRQRYLAHMRTLMDEVFDPAMVSAEIDKYVALIDAEVRADGKKLFQTSEYEQDLVKLKQLFVDRKNFLLQNVELLEEAPVISDAIFSAGGTDWATPDAGTPVNVRTTITGGVQTVNLYYSAGFTGKFTKIEMLDDGNNNDGAAGDGVFGMAIPGQGAGTWVRYYIEAKSDNNSGTARFLPAGAEHNVFLYQVKPDVIANSDIVINEVQPDNSQTAKDEADEYDDWIELHNKSGDEIALGGYYLTDDPDNLTKWTIPANTNIAANGYLIIWADKDEDQGPLHANFKLSSNGEQVLLVNPSEEIVDQVSFPAINTDKTYARTPNGTGDFALQTPTFNAENADVATNRGKEDALGPAEFAVYPNPASTQITLEFGGKQRLLPKEVILYNLLGQQVLQTAITQRGMLDISTIPAGVYFVKSDGYPVKKLVVTR